MKLNGLDLNKIHVFCQVLECQGYRRASERLGLSRSALSQSITSLESQLGVKLFYREGIRLVPTQQALRFYQEVREHHQGLEDAVGRLQGVSPASMTQGLIRVGAYQEFTRAKLIPSLEKFWIDYPKVQLQFFFDSPSRLEMLLDRKKVDLTISIFPHRNRSKDESGKNLISSSRGSRDLLIRKKIYSEELCLIGKRGVFSRPDRWSKLAEYPFIDYYPSHVLFKRWWKAHFNRPSPKIHVRTYAATAEVVTQLVSRGLGVGVVPRYLVDAGVAGEGKGDLEILEPTSNRLVDHMWLNYWRGGWSSERLNSGAQSLLEVFLKFLSNGIA